MSFRPLFSLLAALLALPGGVFADGGESSARPQPAFVIHRDPTLGRPLLVLRKPPKDPAGRNAVDVLELYLEHLRKGEVDQAKRLVRFRVTGMRSAGEFGDITHEDLPKEQKYADMALAELRACEAAFPDYAERLLEAKSYTLGAAVKQKGPFWSISVTSEGLEPGLVPAHVYLSHERGEWKIELSDLKDRVKGGRPMGQAPKTPGRTP